MKAGDRLRIEHAPYLVESVRGDRVVLRNRTAHARKHFEHLLKTRRWRRPSVSATFLLDPATRTIVDTYQLLALGVSSKRIERLYRTLPLVEAP